MHFQFKTQIRQKEGIIIKKYAVIIVVILNNFF